MKNRLPVIIAIPFFTISTLIVSAQEIHPVSGEPLKYCGQTEATDELYKANPGLKEAAALIELQEAKKIISPSTFPPPIYTIPVVFHVLHSYGPENIPDANIIDAMRVLNEDFRKLNADTTQVVNPFKSLIGDAEIEFKLAKLDPSGNCTNGINRVVTPKTYGAGDGANGSQASKSGIQWPRDKYLNIYTVNNIKSGAAGYTYVPSTVASNPSIDGIIIRYDYVGALSPSSSGTSRALGHEVGHWFNLAHCWGSTNQPGVSCGDDGVADTPVTKGWTTCNLSTNDICTVGTDENVQNIMEYAYCQRMFTKLQCSRMRTALQSGTAQRSNLWTTANLTATGVSATATLCKADFSQNKNVVCEGTSITFTDKSTNVTPTSWQWDFDNNGSTDATAQNPTYTFTTAGIYSIKLTVSDGSSTKTTTKTAAVVVLSNTPLSYVPYNESFENASFPYNDFYVYSNNNSSATWNRTTAAGYTGSASLKLDNHSPTVGDVDEFITPAIDMTTITSPTLTFRVAYQRRSSNDTLDGLRVYSSVNCGATWVVRYSKSYSALQTVTSVLGSAYTPSAATQWRLETGNISSTAGMPNLRLKFSFTGHGVGNNCYIDDINVNGVLSVEEEFNSGFGLNVFPNPFDENTTISFNIRDKYKVCIGVYDILGKEVIPVANGSDMDPGSYTLPLNKNNLKAGIYFVKLDVDGYSVMQKMIVQ